MPRIDFYVISGQAANGRSLLACRLAEKAYSLGHRVYIHTASAEQARYMDDLLWTFRQSSFIPHALYPPDETDLSPVLIGWSETSDAVAEDLKKRLLPTGSKSSDHPEDSAPATVLINLTHEIPPSFEQFERVVELVDQNPETLRKSRERFRFFREQGYTPESHQL